MYSCTYHVQNLSLLLHLLHLLLLLLLLLQRSLQHLLLAPQAVQELPATPHALHRPGERKLPPLGGGAWGRGAEQQLLSHLRQHAPLRLTAWLNINVWLIING